MSFYNNIKFIAGTLTGSNNTADPIMGAFRSRIEYDTAASAVPVKILDIFPPVPSSSTSIMFSFPYSSLFLKLIVLKEQSSTLDTTTPIATTGYDCWFQITNPYENNPNFGFPPTHVLHKTLDIDTFSQFPIVGANWNSVGISNPVELTYSGNSPIDSLTLNNFLFPPRYTLVAQPNITKDEDPFFIKGQYLLI